MLLLLSNQTRRKDFSSSTDYRLFDLIRWDMFHACATKSWAHVALIRRTINLLSLAKLRIPEIRQRVHAQNIFISVIHPIPLLNDTWSRLLCLLFAFRFGCDRYA